jgi:hypothetical protein
VKRAAVIAALALVTGLILTTRHSPSVNAQAAVRQAFARTTDAGSSRFDMTFAVPEAYASALQPTGVMDYVHHRGQVDYGEAMRFLFDGDVSYVEWPMPWRKTAPWLRYENGEEDDDPFDLQQRLMQDPARLLQFLRSASDGIQTVGAEDVRGTPTTKLEGTFDFQKVVDNASPDERAELQDLLDFLREDEPTTIPFELWVDGDGVARRVRLEQGEGMSITTEYYDFGVPVHVTPPPAHQNDSDCSGGTSDDSDGVTLEICEQSTTFGDP